MTKTRIPNKFYQPDAKDYNQADFRLNILPEMPDEKCTSCGGVFAPGWLDSRAPVTHVTANDGQVWVRQTLVLECPFCKGDVEHRLPIVKQIARYGFFGDEAYRDVDNKHVCTLTIVGTNQVRLGAVEQKVIDFKKAIAPDVDPTSWSLHMKILKSGDQRLTHPIYKSWDHQKVQSCIEGLYALLNSFDEAFYVVNATGIVHLPADRKKMETAKAYVKKEIYSSLLLHTIYVATSNGVMPYFVFDADRDSNSEIIVHDWARKTFLGSHKNLLYAHLTHGIQIPEPEFVKPASRPLLELADFISYVIGRFVFCRLSNKPNDFDPKRLGKIQYIGFNSNGDMLSTPSSQVGFPWGYFYGNSR